MFKNYLRFLGKSAEREIEKAVVGFLPSGRELTYLDCGCDDGQKTLNRASRIGTRKILGIEILKDKANQAYKRGVKIAGESLEKDWSISDNSINVITATEVVEHLVDLDHFFFEAKRVLKKGGRVIISTENLAAWHNIFALLLGNQPYTGPYLSNRFPIGHHPLSYYWENNAQPKMPPHLNVMTRKALIKILGFYKFKVVGIRQIACYPIFPPISSFLARLFPDHATYIIVSAVKL